MQRVDNLCTGIHTLVPASQRLVLALQEAQKLDVEVRLRHAVSGLSPGWALPMLSLVAPVRFSIDAALDAVA